MIKKKGAGMVMAIMLVSVCGWVAIVAFVIKANMWTGFALCLGGGSLIGLAIVYLMWRWWFKGKAKKKEQPLADRMLDVLKEK